MHGLIRAIEANWRVEPISSYYPVISSCLAIIRGGPRLYKVMSRKKKGYIK
jgi:hypothetical protein